MASRAGSSRPVVSFEAAWRDFLLHRRAENASARTLRAYEAASFQLRDFLSERGRPTAPASIERSDVQAFLGHLVATRSAGTAATRYWGLRAFFGWLVEEGEIDVSPLDRLRPPSQTEKPPDVLTDDEIRGLLHACEGRTLEDRRDAAIVRLLFDTGMRVGELVGMTVDRVDLDAGVARVLGKGRRERDVAVGAKAARDLSRYLRLRVSHPRSESPQLWLGRQGPLTASGVGQMLKVRAVHGGVDPQRVHPHVFRHSFADRWKAMGGSEEDLMSLGGWRSPTVMRRYGSSLAASRARDAHRRLSPGDRL